MSFSSTRAEQPNSSAKGEVAGRLTSSCSPDSKMWLNWQLGMLAAPKGLPPAPGGRGSGGEPSAFGGPNLGLISARPIRPPESDKSPSTLSLKKSEQTMRCEVAPPWL